MNDLISRRDAINELMEALNPNITAFVRAKNAIEGLEPKLSEIIYCKDCKHFVRDDIEEQTPYGFYNTHFNAFCDKHFDIEQGEYIDVKLDDFCSFAERKKE